jgi:uncharacterized membrane protein YphA (DoxX/SURF4 family)
MTIATHHVPTRFTTGAFILHSGWGKWSGNEDQAAAVHGMAAGAYPFLRKVPPTTFLKTLAVTEIAIGAALLVPIVPNKLAGASLTAFAGGLLTMYLRTPTLHKPGSVWPTPAGTGISKDVWMLGIGIELLADTPSTPDR